MDFAFFDSISTDEGFAFFDAFLRAERSAVPHILEAARQQGISTDFSVETLPCVMRWALSQVETRPKAADSSLPSWITTTDGYKRGLFEFSEQSKPLILRIAYYFGECFVRSFEGLRWSVGNPDTAQRNMPVVIGFGNDVELSPILVTENLFKRVLSGEAESDAIDRAVKRWVAYLNPT